MEVRPPTRSDLVLVLLVWSSSLTEDRKSRGVGTVCRTTRKTGEGFGENGRKGNQGKGKNCQKI